MRLPQDRILHIDTELKDGKVNVVAEWQGELVRCKDCSHRFYDKYNDCFMCDRHEYGEYFEDDDFCSWGERRE